MEKFGLFRLLQSDLLQRLSENAQPSAPPSNADPQADVTPDLNGAFPRPPVNESTDKAQTNAEETRTKSNDAYARFIAKQEAFSKKIKPR